MDVDLSLFSTTACIAFLFYHKSELQVMNEANFTFDLIHLGN
jgi:hypothetical protein